jgi:fructokinase
MSRIGIDLGGTKIEALLLGEDGREVKRRRVSTPRDDYEGTLRAIRDLVTRIEADEPSRATVGVGMPGTLSPATGLVKNANSVWLIGRPLVEDLEKLLGRPVRFANDANCFALSEATDGAARGARIVFGVILGTGAGGGLVVDGKVLVGCNAIAGEWGHNPLPWPEPGEWPGPPCYCGRAGCVETFLSGPGLARDHEATAGERLTAEEIGRRAKSGDPTCQGTLGRHERRLARALASVVNIVDPDVIVIGGGLSRLRGLYDAVPRLWAPYVFSDRVETRVVSPVHGDSSGVRGAAWLWGRGAGEGRRGVPEGT